MRNAISNYLNGEALDIDDRFAPALAIAHYTWQFKSFSDPAAVFFQLQINRQIHTFILRQ